MLKVILLILVAECWNTIGQILFKKSTNTVEVQSLRGVSTNLRFLKNVLMKPLIWLGLGSMTIGLMIWFIALSGADLSVVSPIGSLQYILILISAHLFLGEKINRMKLTGTLLVVLGIILVAMS
jgi:drug/metabolite transporter (DMT)-like permease